MCFSSKPPEAPPPIPAAPPVIAPVLESADKESRNASSKLAANRGRNSLRIDRTQNVAGGASNGLNIPT